MGDLRSLVYALLAQAGIRKGSGSQRDYLAGRDMVTGLKPYERAVRYVADYVGV